MTRRSNACPPVRRWRRDTLPVRRVPFSTANEANASRWLDFTQAAACLCSDIVARCPELAHIHPDYVLISMVPARSTSPYGLQSRLTPLRFAQGATDRRQGHTLFRVQRYEVSGLEMLYLLTFCVPRFLRLPFSEKLLTIFHELYHISPAFDGDLRRLPGRCSMHGHSKQAYDKYMAKLARAYLAQQPPEALLAFLRGNLSSLAESYDGIQGVVVPRPLIYPVEQRR
ncbi:MAG: hypothetical protein SNJ82_12985 [Gemmataceae bacterium]